MHALLLLAAPLAAGQELAEMLWQDGVEARGGLFNCPGGYAMPAPFPRDADNATLPLVVEAVSMSATENHVDADGDVVIRQGDRRLSATSATLDESASRVRAVGDVRFDEPGLSVRGVEATVEFEGAAASVEAAEFVLADLELRGRAGRMARQGNVVVLESATVTSCPPRNTTWRIEAESIRLDAATAIATSRHARLKIGRVPVFYAPYLRFPVGGGRSSGFLVPDIYQGRDGIDLSLPYYFNLAANYDATLTPRWIAQRGLGVESEFRHRSRRADSSLDAAYLPGDRDYDTEAAGATPDPATGTSSADRWSLNIDHQGRWGNLVTEVDVESVSDDDYFGDFAQEEGVASRVALERRGEVAYRHGGLVARLLAQGFQRLESGQQPYRRLPAADVSYAGRLAGPLTWSMGAAWASFVSPDRDVVAGQRYHVEPGLRLGFHRPWGFVDLVGGVRRTGYDLTGAEGDSSPRRVVRTGVLDAGLFLEREAALASGAGTQTLEPRVYYLRQSYADQQDLPNFDSTPLTFSYRQLFRDNRFAGLDRIGDANRLSVGVASRLLNAEGEEVLAARLGAMLHVNEPRIGLGAAGRPDPDVVGEFARRHGRFQVVSRVAWDAAGSELDELGAGLSYRRDARRIVNLAYRRRFPDVDQTDLSLHWPLPGFGDRLSAFGRWNHDWRRGQIVESFAGLAYANCCVAVKLLWHQTIDERRNPRHAATTTDSGLMLQVSFKGLGGFGSKVDSRLVRGIKGYRPNGG